MEAFTNTIVVCMKLQRLQHLKQTVHVPQQNPLPQFRLISGRWDENSNNSSSSENNGKKDLKRDIISNSDSSNEKNSEKKEGSSGSSSGGGISNNYGPEKEGNEDESTEEATESLTSSATDSSTIGATGSAGLVSTCSGEVWSKHVDGGSTFDAGSTPAESVSLNAHADDADDNEAANWSATSTDENSLFLQRVSSSDVNRRCWVCYATEDDDDEDANSGELVNPCGCKGSTKWVHQTCVNLWIDEVQRGNASKEIKCPYCLEPFACEYPQPSVFFRCLNAVDACYTRACNLVSEGNLLGVLAFTTVAVSATKIFKSQIKEVLFLARGTTYLQQVALGVCLQLVVPTSLIILEQQLQILEDRVARATTPILTSDLRIENRPDPELDADNVNLIISALLFPSIALSTGNALFTRVIDNNFKRYLAGGAVYVMVRGFFKTIYKRNQLGLQRKRRVVNRVVKAEK